MALVVLSKVEQRLDAVRAVLGGAKISEVAELVGVSCVKDCGQFLGLLIMQRLLLLRVGR